VWITCRNTVLGIAATVALSVLSPLLAQSTLPTLVPPAPAGQSAPQSGTSTNASDANFPIISEIIVEGTQRIESSTVQSYARVKAGDRMVPDLVNDALKALFATGLFADVTIRREGTALVVRIVENPIINRIAFEGNKRIKDEVLENEVQLRSRIVYTRTRVQSDVKRILDLYRRSGRFAANVEPKVIQLEQNRVDLVFEIVEGPETKIQNISFIGNKRFSDRALRSVILTKEARWYRFFGSSSHYDPDRLTFDRELLRRHYLKRGYADFRVMSAVAELSQNRREFIVTITIEEGDRYQFGNVEIISKIEEVQAEQFTNLIEFDTGDWYNTEQVDDTALVITDAVGNFGYGFVDVRTKPEKKREERIINLVFEIEEAPRVFVQQIDIRGNVRTLDSVIRREFRLVEGDAFNSSKIRRSRDRIRNLGFFKKVYVNTIVGTSPDKTVVEVDVEEQSTGEVSIGGGISTAVGPIADISIFERNLLGKGQELSASFQISAVSQEFDISFSEPYFLERQLSAGFDLFHTTEDKIADSSFTAKRAGFVLRVGYEFNERLSQGLRYSISHETVENVKDEASSFIKSQKGTFYNSLIGQTLTRDERNSRADPTDGYFVSLSNDLAGFGGTEHYLRSTLNSGYYYSFTDQIIAGLTGQLGYIFGIGDQIRINDRYFLGGDNLRGFESRGVGPRDSITDDALGGNTVLSATAELSFPTALHGVSGALFTDVGMLTGTEDSGAVILDEASLRGSVGFGLGWRSPMGPLRVNFSVPYLKENFDKTEVFQFNFGTRF
jgi:outer membrane protein insertion porin family